MRKEDSMRCTITVARDIGEEDWSEREVDVEFTFLPGQRGGMETEPIEDAVELEEATFADDDSPCELTEREEDRAKRAALEMMADNSPEYARWMRWNRW